MSQQPTKVTLKRKATEEPPEILFLENQQQATAAGDTQQFHYVRATTSDGTAGDGPLRKKAKNQGEFVKRIFQLDRKRKASGNGEDGVSGKVATVTEKRARVVDVNGLEEVVEVAGEGAQAFKRPSRQDYATPVKLGTRETHTERKRFEQLSEDLQKYALEEVDREREIEAQSQRQSRTPPQRNPASPDQHRQRITPPRLSGKRSNEIHKQRIASYNFHSTMFHKVNERERPTKAREDGDYVYDTYILSAKPQPNAIDIDSDRVGYLIITEEDEELWQTYYIDEETAALDRENERLDEDEDEEDENAEDFHGADYPEHDLSEEDEMGNGHSGYGYSWDRRGGGGVEDGSEGEAWDEDVAKYSGDEEDGEDSEFGSAFTAGRYQRMEARYLRT